MTSKQRAYLKGLAMNIDPVFQIGKSSLTPEITQAVDEALEARELILSLIHIYCPLLRLLSTGKASALSIWALRLSAVCWDLCAPGRSHAQRCFLPGKDL